MTQQRKISVVGLGYVGLTTLVAFGQMMKVIGFDIDESRIAELKKGRDRNGELTSQDIKTAKIHFTTNPKELKKANFHVISVPTPLDGKRPDLTMLLNASDMVGKQLKKGDMVVYESTVYPGATEEKCIPALERASKLRCGKDFSVGYSPERINPSDKEHSFWNVTKIVSATDKAALDIVAKAFESVVKAGVFRVSSIRIAEATKVIENTQRDLNISLMNEIALILHSLGMDISEVLAAAKTKWNFIPYRPGLVGGHCIGVNSDYLAYKAEQAGYHPDVILAGRRVNDYMPKFIAEKTIKKLIHIGVPIKRARIAVLGLTYKENCSDLRDTKIIDLVNELKSYDTEILIHDPLADSKEAKKEYGIMLADWKNLIDIDAIILAVRHRQYVELNGNQLKRMLRNRGLIMDIKDILNPKDFEGTGITFWRL